MVIGLVFLTIFFGVLGLICIIAGMSNDEPGGVGIGALFLLFSILGIVSIKNYTNKVDKELSKTPKQLKVRELERNSKFVVQDSSSLYKIGDTVLVNMKTLKIDPKDSVGMYCVIDTIK